MEYDIEALIQAHGLPGQRYEEDGIAWWYGSGRLTVCARADINRQISVLFRHLPDGTNIPDEIAKLGGRIKQTVQDDQND